MNERQLIPLADYSRQTLEVGTPPLYLFDEQARPANKELIALSLQLRMVEALEQQNTLQAEPNPLTLAEYGELHVLLRQESPRLIAALLVEGSEDPDKLVRLCELVTKLLSGIDGGQPIDFPAKEGSPAT